MHTHAHEKSIRSVWKSISCANTACQKHEQTASKSIRTDINSTSFTEQHRKFQIYTYTSAKWSDNVICHLSAWPKRSELTSKPNSKSGEQFNIFEVEHKRYKNVRKNITDRMGWTLDIGHRAVLALQSPTIQLHWNNNINGIAKSDKSRKCVYFKRLTNWINYNACNKKKKVFFSHIR